MSGLLTELDRLEGLIKADCDRRLGAIAELRRTAAVFGVENPVTRVVGGLGAIVELPGKKEKKPHAKTAKSAKGNRQKVARINGTGLAARGLLPKESKTQAVARPWVEGLKAGTEFTLGELSAKVCAATGVREETVKIRMWAFLGSMVKKGVIAKAEKGRYRKEGGEWQRRAGDNAALPTLDKNGAWAMRERIAAELAAQKQPSEEES